MSQTPSLVVVGNLMVDDVVLPTGLTRMAQAGGAALFSALAASLWMRPVGCVSRCGADYPPHVLETLAVKGVDLAGVHKIPGAGGRTWLLYEGTRRHIVPWLDTPSHVAVSPVPADLPAHYQHARAFHLAPMPFAIQREWVHFLAGRPRTFVSLDPNLPVQPDTLDAWREVLTHVDVLFLGPDELQLPGAAANLHASLTPLVSGRLKWIVIKQGDKGGVLLDARSGGGTRWVPGPWAVEDPTGAGDSFAAGMLSGMLEDRPVHEWLGRGVVSAGLALQDWGAAGLLRSTPQQARERAEQLLNGSVA